MQELTVDTTVLKKLEGEVAATADRVRSLSPSDALTPGEQSLPATSTGSALDALGRRMEAGLKGYASSTEAIAQRLGASASAYEAVDQNVGAKLQHLAEAAREAFHAIDHD